MSDRVVVMREGAIEQTGTPREVYENPRNLFVAGFVGEINVFDAEVTGAADGGRLRARMAGQEVELHARGRIYNPGARLHVLLRPEDLRLLPQDAGRGIAGQVVERNYKGMTLDSVVRLDTGQELRASEFFDESDPDFDYRRGEPVRVSWVPGWEKLLPHED